MKVLAEATGGGTDAAFAGLNSKAAIFRSAYGLIW